MSNAASAYKRFAKWEGIWVQMQVAKLSIVSDKSVSTDSEADI